MSIIPIPSKSPVNQEPPPHYDYLPCYNELFKTYETERLILGRVDQYDIEPLAKIILNKKVNYHFQRPILYLPNFDKAYEYVRNQATSSIVFTIKLKQSFIQIGLIGFYYVDLTCKEIGIFYLIGEEYQKKGYASEAACPLIRHLFENLPLTMTLKIDFEVSNQGSRKIAQKICDDIMKYHPTYKYGELIPFTDKYKLINEPPVWGQIKYYFEGYDRRCYVLYPQGFFNNLEYFEVLSNGYYITKQ